MSARPFRVLGLQQIAVGAAKKDALRRLWIDLLGLTLQGNFRSESENVDEDIAQAGRRPLASWGDLTEPPDPDRRARRPRARRLVGRLHFWSAVNRAVATLSSVVCPSMAARTSRTCGRWRGKRTIRVGSSRGCPLRKRVIAAVVKGPSKKRWSSSKMTSASTWATTSPTT